MKLDDNSFSFAYIHDSLAHSYRAQVWWADSSSRVSCSSSAPHHHQPFSYVSLRVFARTLIRGDDFPCDYYRYYYSQDGASREVWRCSFGVLCTYVVVYGVVAHSLMLTLDWMADARRVCGCHHRARALYAPSSHRHHQQLSCLVIAFYLAPQEDEYIGDDSF